MINEALGNQFFPRQSYSTHTELQFSHEKLIKFHILEIEGREDFFGNEDQFHDNT